MSLSLNSTSLSPQLFVSLISQTHTNTHTEAITADSMAVVADLTFVLGFFIWVSIGFDFDLI